MNSLALLRRPALAWVALCLAAGAAVGSYAADPSTASSLLIAMRWAAVAGLAAFAARRPDLGVWVVLASFALNDYGRIVVSPIPLTLFQVALAGSLAGWAWRLLAGAVPWRRLDPMRAALALPMLAAAWSIPLSLDPARSALGAARLGALWLFALFVAYYAEDERRRSRMLDVFVVVGVVLAIVSFVQYALPGVPLGNTHTQFDASGIETLVRPAAFYLDTNFLAGYLSVASLVAAVRVAHARSWRAAAVWALPALTCAAAMALTLSRSGLVGFLAGTAAVVLTAPPKRRTWLLVIALVLAVAAVPVLPDRYTKRITSLGNVMSEGSLATRFLMLGSTFEIIRDYWGTGTGLSAFDVAYPEYRRVGSLPRILRPHEVPLAMPAEMGVAGLVAEAGLLGGLLWALRRAKRRGWRVEDSAVLVGLVTLLAQSWFQYYLYFECLWLFSAFAAAAASSSEGVSRV